MTVQFIGNFTEAMKQYTEEKISKKSIARTWGLLKEILHNL